MSNINQTPLEIVEELLKKFPNKTLEAKLAELRKTKVNILLVGGTGVGKSSTINALFNIEDAKVGTGHNPETKEITPYELKNIVLWDCPGLGDSEQEDKRFIEMIKQKLQEKDEKGDALIDLVLLVIDSTTRDLGTVYALLKETIVPNIRPNEQGEMDRLIVALNKIDSVEGGDLWDRENNKPTEELFFYMDQKVASVKKRIEEDSGFKCEPMYYSAGNKLRNKQAYNISKLLSIIISRVQAKKRAVILEDKNVDDGNFQYNDGDYQPEAEKSVWSSIFGFFGEAAKELIVVFSDPHKLEKIKETIKGTVNFIADVVDILKSVKPNK